MSDTAPAPANATAPAAPLRKLRFHVLRHDPRDPLSVPHTEVFELDEAAGMTLFIALNEDPRTARRVARVRLRVPRRDLRQLTAMI